MSTEDFFRIISWTKNELNAVKSKNTSKQQLLQRVKYFWTWLLWGWFTRCCMEVLWRDEQRGRQFKNRFCSQLAGVCVCSKLFVKCMLHAAFEICAIECELALLLWSFSMKQRAAGVLIIQSINQSIRETLYLYSTFYAQQNGLSNKI